MKKSHELKIHPRYYREVLSGEKTFEIRKNDRDFKPGEGIVLKEFADGEYTHAKPLYGRIGYMTDYEQKPGYVVFSIMISLDNY